MKLSPLFKNFLPYLILVVFGFLLYYQTLSFSLVYLDDNKLIIDNQATLHEAGLFKIFTSDVFFSGSENSFYYRPLLNVSFLIDELGGGTLPFFFHFTNLIWHLLAASLIFLVFKKYFFSEKIALFLALIFLAHPALSQAVAWIPGRNDSLLTVFILASFGLFLNFLKTDRIIYFWWHLVFFILALFVKETAIFLPVICLAYYYLFDDKFTPDNKKANFLIISATWFSSILLWYLFRKVSLSPNSSLSDLIISGLQNLPTILIYLGKVIFPFNLSVYPILADSTYWWGLSSVLLMAVALYYTPQANWRRLFFGLLWFLIFLLPSFLSPDPGSTWSFFEHRLYLPIIGLLLCIAELYPLKNLKWLNKKSRVIALAIILFLTSLTLWHTRYFSDRLTFWTEAAQTSPNSAFVQNNLGAMYHLEDNLKQAQEHYSKALQLDPSQRLVHNNLGLIAVSQKKYSEAEREYQQELIINPYYDNAWVNLGILYVKLKRFSEASACFQQAYQLNPNNAQAYDNLLILSSKVE